MERDGLVSAIKMLRQQQPKKKAETLMFPPFFCAQEFPHTYLVSSEKHFHQSYKVGLKKILCGLKKISCGLNEKISAETLQRFASKFFVKWL
jgi:hypothetical protein